VENDREREIGENAAVGREDAKPVSDVWIQNGDVKSDRQSAEREQPVVPRNAIGRLLCISFDRDKNTSEHKCENQRQILLLEKSDLKVVVRSEEHTSELQSGVDLVYRLLLEKKNRQI